MKLIKKLLFVVFAIISASLICFGVDHYQNKSSNNVKIQKSIFKKAKKTLDPKKNGTNDALKKTGNDRTSAI